MRLKRYTSQEIRRILEEEDEESLPSDYEEETDEEWSAPIHDDVSPLDIVEDIQILVTDDNVPDETELVITAPSSSQPTLEDSLPTVSDENRSQKRKWRKKPEPANDTEFRPAFFVHSADSCTPLETFMTFFDDAIFEKIHYETNLKSVQNGKPISMSENELKVFIGINIVMGYHDLPNIKSYWNSADDLNVPAISKAMSRERFQTILSNLHVNDNTQIDPSKKDKIFKIRPLLEHLNRVFLQRRSVKEYLSIDESMIRFKGRSSLKQYNPMKPIKRGYKLWCVSDDNGYIYRTILYTGKANSENQADIRKEFGLGGDVVLSLLKDIKLGDNHKVHMDNYFSSIPLMEELKNRKILGCGTIRSNRKEVPQLKEDKTLKRGEFDYRSTPSGITVYKWKDSKAVHFISNHHGIETTSVQRKQKDGTKATVSCPHVVKDYNQHMGGVDKHDMLRQLYGTDRKNVKWWHRIFFGLLDMSIVNSFIVYSENNQESSMTLFNFYRDVGRGLLAFSERTNPGPQKRRRLNYSTPESVRLANVGVHWPEFTTSKNRCEVCSKNGITARPLNKCSHCGVHLCCNAKRNCFRIYHSK